MRGFVAVVEDDRVLLRNLRRSLEADGFHVLWAVPDAAGALTAADAGGTAPDALVVDVGLPDADGRDLIAALRGRGLGAPVLVLSARTSLADRLSGFAAGADDVMAKPFSLAELAARLDVLVRRRSPEPAADGPLALDPVAHGVAGPTAVPLSPIEYRLLAALVARRGTVVRRAGLVAAGWPPGAIVAENTLDSYVSRVRAALRRAGVAEQVENVRGVGYRLS